MTDPRQPAITWTAAQVSRALPGLRFVPAARRNSRKIGGLRELRRSLCASWVPRAISGLRWAHCFLGGFREVGTNTGSADQFLVSCIDQGDLDLRERETLTLIDQGKPVVFLLRFVPRHPFNNHEPADQDLFRRISSMLRIGWLSWGQATPVDCLTPDFRDLRHELWDGVHCPPL